MAAVEGLLDDVATDEPGAADHEDAHRPDASAAAGRPGSRGGPQQAGQGADDERLRRVGLAQLGVAADALDGQDQRDALGPAGQQRRGHRRPLEEADPGAAAQHGVRLPGVAVQDVRSSLARAAGRARRWPSRRGRPIRDRRLLLGGCRRRAAGTGVRAGRNSRRISRKMPRTTTPPPVVAAATPSTSAAASRHPSAGSVGCAAATAAASASSTVARTAAGSTGSRTQRRSSGRVAGAAVGEQQQQQGEDRHRSPSLPPAPDASATATRWAASSRAGPSRCQSAACSRCETACLVMPSRSGHLHLGEPAGRQVDGLPAALAAALDQRRDQVERGLRMRGGGDGGAAHRQPGGPATSPG